MNEPVADETRSILDGHIVLARKLASANHYPAIDVRASKSRGWMRSPRASIATWHARWCRGSPPMPMSNCSSRSANTRRVRRRGRYRHRQDERHQPVPAPAHRRVRQLRRHARQAAGPDARRASRDDRPDQGAAPHQAAARASRRSARSRPSVARVAEAQQRRARAREVVAESAASLPAREDAIGAELLGKVVEPDAFDEARAKVVELENGPRPPEGRGGARGPCAEPAGGRAPGGDPRPQSRASRRVTNTTSSPTSWCARRWRSSMPRKRSRSRTCSPAGRRCRHDAHRTAQSWTGGRGQAAERLTLRSRPRAGARAPAARGRPSAPASAISSARTITVRCVRRRRAARHAAAQPGRVRGKPAPRAR